MSKKLPTAALTALAAVLVLTSCTDGRRAAYIPDSTPEPAYIPVTVTTPEPVQTAPADTPELPPAATPAPTPTPAPVLAETPLPKISIKKSPTDETVEEGGKAIFTARADNASGIIWIAVSPDTKTTYRIEELPDHFNGMTVDGQGTEKIHLYSIPLNFSGWRIQCRFDGNGGPLFSAGAYVKVKAKPAPASPSYAPSSADEQSRRAFSTATDYAAVVKKYADYCHFTAGGVENFTYSSDAKYGEFRVVLTRGAVKLVCVLRAYPGEQDTCCPESLTWYESDSAVKSYSFGRNDPESWNHLEKTIIDINNSYGDGTAGQGNQ